MSVSESSEYVKARTKLLAEYFSIWGWVLSTGRGNTVLIYISSKLRLHIPKTNWLQLLLRRITISEPTGLKMTDITYPFYHQGTLVEEISVMPGSEFDRFTS